MQCCSQSKYNAPVSNCVLLEENAAGDTRTCDMNNGVDYTMFGACASLDKDKCGSSWQKDSFWLWCCPNMSDMTVDYTGCQWQYEFDGGENLSCKSGNWLLNGMCGSNKKP